MWGKKHPKHPQILGVFSPIFSGRSTSTSWIHHINSAPAVVAHAASPPQGPKASHGRGNLRSWHGYSGTSSRPPGGVGCWPSFFLQNLQNHLTKISDECGSGRMCSFEGVHLKSEATKAAPLSAQITSEIIDKKTLHKGKDRESFLKCWKYKRNVRFVPTPEFLAQG